MSESIIIKNVRCSFPQFFKLKGEDGEEYGPGVTLILENPEHIAQIKEVDAIIQRTINSNPALKKQPPKGEKICLKSPESESQREEYPAGCFLIKANSSNQKPTVLHKNAEKATEHDNPIYSGCYINAKIEIWGQNHPKFGRRVNAKLLAVQFVTDGPSFDGGHVDEATAIEGFGSLEDEKADAEALGGSDGLTGLSSFLD